MNNYIAVIGDIINSKIIEDRRTFQDDFKKILSMINDKYKANIISNFTITTGDEFQGILRIDKNLLKILDELYVNIPKDFRLGIGYGQITTEINPQLSIGADGPAFWRAREAIDYVHKNNYKNRCNIYFIGDRELDSTINTIFLLSETIKSQWTILQEETFKMMIREGIYSENFNQQDFAKRINITESSLSKRLSAGNIKIYLRAREEISKILELYYD